MTSSSASPEAARSALVLAVYALFLLAPVALAIAGIRLARRPGKMSVR